MDQLTGALIGLAKACQNNPKTEHTTRILVEGLYTTRTNENVDNKILEEMLQKVKAEKYTIVPDCAVCKNPCGNTDDYDMNQLQNAEEEILSLKLKILSGIREMAFYVYHGTEPGCLDEEIDIFFYKALCILSYDFSMEELLPVVLETEQMKLKCMELYNSNVKIPGK